MMSSKNTLFRTGLAAMLTGFVLILLHSPVSLAEEPKPESDSAILFRHIREMKIENAVEEFSEHSFNSHLSDAELDSMLKENGMSVTGGQIFYSPDSVFKIVVVYGESCGAYCNPYNKSWLHFNDGSQMSINGAGFYGALEIQLLPDGKYLIIENGWGRPAGVFTVNYITAKVVSFEDHKMNVSEFIHKDELEDHLALSFSQEYFIDSEQYLHYDAKKQRLNYQFGNDLNYCCSVDSAYIYKGYYAYDKGQFVQKDEKKTYIKVNNE